MPLVFFRNYADIYSMKLSKLQIIFISGIAALLLLVAGAFTTIYAVTYKPTIAFYNVPENISSLLQKEIQEMPLTENKKKKVVFNFIELNGAEPLSKQKAVKKASMIFAMQDMDINEFARSNKKVVPMDLELASGMPTTTRENLIAKDKKLFVLPLLYDFYQIDVDRSAFQATGLRGIDTWNDLVAFGKATYAPEMDYAPFLFPGGDNDELLNVIGSLTEALEGTEALKEAERKIYRAYKTGKADRLASVVEELSLPGMPFNAAVTEIADLIKQEILHPSTLAIKENDAIFYMENSLCNTAAIRLSTHRKIKNKAVNRYTSIYFPGKENNPDRTFSAPTICGILMSKKDYSKKIMKYLSSSLQGQLGLKSSWAPVLANCPTADKQADDVRFWIAASQGPHMPLAGAVPSEEMQKIAAEAFRIQIRLKVNQG